jgi:hypothetical protein
MDMQFFPAELKALPQWCVATLLPDDDGKENKAPRDPKNGKAASTTDSRTWGTFEQAIAYRDELRSSGRAPRAQVGFVFNEGDPFAVIDLDTYKAKYPQVKVLHDEILRNAESYTELSQSGLGNHIIGYGLVINGARSETHCVELYSHARFMICTGNVGTGGTIQPLASIQSLLDRLYELLRGQLTETVSWRELGDGEESLLSDQEIVERAMAASNAEKFNRLCKGDIDTYHGGNWSNADESLLQFFCFYTKDNVQVERLFRRSKLALRDKVDRPDYIPRSIGYARDRLAKDKPPDLDHTAIVDRAREVAQAVKDAENAEHYARTSELQMLELEMSKPVHAPISAIDKQKPKPPAPFVYPPGLVGEIAQYNFAAAIRPVPEIALAGAIATMAGIVGRQYNISGTGLNLYILLLAKTGTGKESMQSAIDRLFADVTKTVPAAETFLGPSRFASGQALNKRFQKQPCFVSILGEFGDTMRKLTNPRAQGPELSLAQELKDMFHKSGANQMLRATVHSDAEKNTANVASPTLTILGETAPEPFFAALDESMVDSGFLPRFMIMEYKGERPPRNVSPMTEPPGALVQRVADLTAACLQMQQNRQVFVVNADAEGLALLDRFDKRADGEMKGASEVAQQLWNRAHIKALRLAALIAVGINYTAPVVTREVATWAIDMIEQDVDVLLGRFASGDIGDGDARMFADLRLVVTGYMTKGAKGCDEYRAKGCIPIRFLAQRTANRPAFKKHRDGATRSLKNTLDAMINSGVLVQIDKKMAHEWFKTSGAVYALGDQWAM